MNAVIGVLLVFMNGNILAGKVTGAYPDLETCNAKVAALPAPPGVPDGARLGSFCADLADEINKPAPSAQSEKPLLPKDAPHSNITDL